MPSPNARIYLDCAASAPMDPGVAEVMAHVHTHQGANPSSIHSAGVDAMKQVELARMCIAVALGGGPEELIFTGSATEANNHAIKGVVWAAEGDKKHVIVSSVEHPSVLEVARWLASSGQIELTVLPVDPTGLVQAAEVARALRPHTVLVSVMHVNNETGAAQPIEAIARICAEHGTVFHVDATQGFMKLPLHARRQGIDLITVNAHKIHGPKGVGALLCRKGTALAPILHGGGHEMGHRSGTLNVAGIVGFGEAVARYEKTEQTRLATLRSRLIAGLEEFCPNLRIHGPRVGGSGTILNLGIPGYQGKWLATQLDRHGFMVSASSACHATKLTPSHVMIAMGLTEAEADEALRVSFGRFTQTQHIDQLLDALSTLLTERAA